MRSCRMTFILRKCYFSFCRAVILVIFQKDHKSGVKWLLLKGEISFYFCLWLIYQSCEQFGLKDKCLQCFLVSWPNMALLELILSDTLKCCSQSWFIIGVGLPIDHWVAVFLVDYNDLQWFDQVFQIQLVLAWRVCLHWRIVSNWWPGGWRRTPAPECKGNVFFLKIEKWKCH